MAAFMRRFRRKRKVSSEMHNRWGDLSISSPNEGSWCDQPSITVTPDVSPEPRWRNSSLSSLDRQNASPRAGDMLRPKTAGERTVSIDSAMSMPVGHYDANVQRRFKRKQKQPGQGLGISDHKDGGSWGNSTLDESSDDEAEDTSSIPAASGSLKGRRSESIRDTRLDEADYTHRASKSPPLSVTSRMRHSLQSNTTATTTLTEPSVSMPGTASSKHTSFTSSTPSGTSEDPRLLYNAAYQEKKNAHRSNNKHRVSESTQRHELVPSYDDLYG
ncbi:hypothetical protein ASPWEDRAFT_146166 [Aspergillus wentii DTO 134E9]|uniref:Uncharacterized protein n=1 Tax=Aspergillus wentii DTO 134E9 TaxID=1073089 RepID=A0A1L9S1H0_ASPWE|nr:uncharacterized protein ASPWEDRAFT_146166 [Aspergillus wentii DTO 134E9]KAI9931008.1 hypothetical protein MW887_010663 [Aspergillus wentii]OJJ40998.1 hypothetical protein ASPWEDRAFT_146166 [Aspergillus wentii DTO 134E9]